MLYHLKGLDYVGDPFEVPEIRAASDKQGRDWKVVRKAVKFLTNVYVNASLAASIGSFPAVTPDLPKGLRRPNRIYELIGDFHRPIADRFQSGCGVELMRKESDICALILADSQRANVPILPVYDSYIVQRRSKEWLRKAMTDNYRKELGFDPVVS